MTTCSFEERSTDGLDGVPPTRQCRQRHQHMRPPAARADPPARPGTDVVPVLVSDHPGAGVPPRGQPSGTGARQPPAKQVELDLVLVQRDDHIRFFLPCRQSQRSRPWGKGQLVLGIMTVAGRDRKTTLLRATGPRPACKRQRQPNDHQGCSEIMAPDAASMLKLRDAQQRSGLMWRL